MTGKPNYRHWSEVPETLATKTTLGKEGLKPRDLEDFAATVTYDRGRQIARLYLRNEAVEKRKVSDATRQKLSEAYERTQDRKHEEEQQWMRQQEREHRTAVMQAFLASLPEDPRDRRILDTETTDLADEGGEVISVTVVDGWGQVLFDQLIQPACGWIADGARGVHGISIEMLQNQPTFADIWQDLHSVLKGKEVYAFNSDFDLKVLRNTRNRTGLTKEQFPFVNRKWHCLMHVASVAVGPPNWQSHPGGHPYLEDFFWLSLEEARTEVARSIHQPLSPFETHTSLGDAQAARQLLEQLVAFAKHLEAGTLPRYLTGADPYDIPQRVQ